MEYVNYPSLGYYITAVNGLQEDPDAQLYWGFGRRSLPPAGDCLFPVGKGSTNRTTFDHPRLKNSRFPKTRKISL